MLGVWLCGAVEDGSDEDRAGVSGTAVRMDLVGCVGYAAGLVGRKLDTAGFEKAPGAERT